MTFNEDIERDVILLNAAMVGGLDAVRAAAMLMPDFQGGPDVVTAYAEWMADPARRPYRAKVAMAAVKPKSAPPLDREGYSQ